MSSLRPSITANRAETAPRGFHPDLGHGYGFEDGSFRVPKSEPDAVIIEVDRRERERMGEIETVPPSVAAREADRQFIREVFDAVFLEDLQSFWKNGRPKRLRESVGTKFLLLAWIVDPGTLSSDGNDISLTQLAKKLGCTAPALSPITAKISRRLNLRNAFQLHDSQPGRAKAKSEHDEDDDVADHKQEEEEINEAN